MYGITDMAPLTKMYICVSKQPTFAYFCHNLFAHLLQFTYSSQRSEAGQRISPFTTNKWTVRSVKLTLHYTITTSFKSVLTAYCCPHGCFLRVSSHCEQAGHIVVTAINVKPCLLYLLRFTYLGLLSFFLTVGVDSVGRS